MDWFLIISLFTSFIIGITVHETAHAWMGYKLGDSTAKDEGRISLNPVRHIDPIGSLLLPIIGLLTPAMMLIGWAKPTPYNPANLKDLKKDELLIAVAGPVSNILLAIAVNILAIIMAFFVGVLGMNIDTNEGIFRFLTYVIYGNLLLAFFNLLPIPPLDGGSFLKIVLPQRFNALIMFLNNFGFMILVALSFTPAGDILTNYLSTTVQFSMKLLGYEF